MIKIAFGLQKGGVGKTTSTISTGYALAKLGKRVLLVDSDPQANLTSSCLLDPRSFKLNIYDLFKKGSLKTSNAIVKTQWDFDLIPSSIVLASTEVELVSAFQREQVLAEKFQELEGLGYDYVLTDSPPSLGLLTVNVLAASDRVVMPVQCQLLSIMGLQAFIDVVELVQKINRTLRISGVLLTMYDPRTGVSREVENNVREILGDLVFDTRIGNFTALSNIPRRGPIQVWEPKHPASQQYNAFAEELINRLEQENH
ncbi:ParA family protein [Candidatus Chlorohelix sp.]|uniref:ParA family protein n=1 Tax=Candidatus Chlorohelix sp. TaxID=3139201 RepID=UPI003068C499